MESNNENKQYDCSRGCEVYRTDEGELNCSYRQGCCKLEVYDWLAGVGHEQVRNYFEVRFKNTRKGIYVNGSGQTVKTGDIVIVEATNGHDVGIVTLEGPVVARQMACKKIDPATGETLAERLGSSDSKVVEKASEDFKGIVKTRNQKKLDNRYRRAKLATAFLGGDTSKIQRGKLDKDGNIKDSGSGGALKAFGTAFMDFGQVALKTAGKLTGASSVWKQLGDAGVVDEAKLSLQRATNVFGINLTNAKQFRTKKQQEDFDSDETKAQVQEQTETMKGLTNAMDKTNKQIADLVSALGSMRSSGRASTPPPRGGSGSTSGSGSTGSTGSSGGTPPSTP